MANGNNGNNSSNSNNGNNGNNGNGNNGNGNNGNGNSNGNSDAVSTKDNHAVGDTAFQNNSAAKDGAASIVVDYMAGTVSIDLHALLANEPGSAAFAGIVNGQTLVTDTAGISYTNGWSGNTSTSYSYGNEVISMSIADALSLGLLDTNGGGFDFVIRMANGTYSTAHASVTGLESGHWVDLAHNGSFDNLVSNSATWHSINGSAEGGVGYWAEGLNDVAGWTGSVNGNDQQIEVMTLAYLNQEASSPVGGQIHEGHVVDTQSSPGGLTLVQNVIGTDWAELTDDDHVIYGGAPGSKLTGNLNDGTQIGQISVAVTVAAEDILNYGHTSLDDMLSIYLGGHLVGNITMDDFAVKDADGNVTGYDYNTFHLFQFASLDNGLVDQNTQIVIVDHSASDALTGIYADDLALFHNAVSDGNYGGDIGFALNHVSVLEWVAYNHGDWVI
ncbi:MAG: hypothetical protein LBF16_15330 [Pseudomonadales bacterium]|jgi:hypothetical protein|nr:hypothetical protein [Pseudomonadales bacterium]